MSETDKRSILQEFQQLTSLESPFIVKVEELYEDHRGYMYLVTEFLECGNLKRTINEIEDDGKFFSEIQILDIFTLVLLGVANCH